MVKDGSKKNQNLIEFFKLFLRDVKVESFLISRHLFCSFSDAPSTLPFTATPLFMQIKTVKVVYMSCKFSSHLTFDSQKIPKKLTQKAHFAVGFQKFFDHALLRPMGDAPIFLEMKGLIEIHNRGKFH